MKIEHLIVGVTQIRNKTTNKIEVVTVDHISAFKEFPRSFVEEYEHIELTVEILTNGGFIFKKMSGIGGAVDYRHTGHWCLRDKAYFRGSQSSYYTSKIPNRGFDIYYYNYPNEEKEMLYWYQVQMIVYSTSTINHRVFTYETSS